MKTRTHKTKPLGGWADIIKHERNVAHRFVPKALAFFPWPKKWSKLKDKSAWERKWCSSGGSWVLGSVLAAETCPLDEPASAALSTFG